MDARDKVEGVDGPGDFGIQPPFFYWRSRAWMASQAVGRSLGMVSNESFPEVFCH